MKTEVALAPSPFPLLVMTLLIAAIFFYGLGRGVQERGKEVVRRSEVFQVVPMEGVEPTRPRGH